MSARRSVVLVPAPEAEDAVGAHRLWNDPSAAKGMPAHVTLLFPFVPAEQIDTGVLTALAEITAARAPFAYTLTGFGRFDDRVLWLRPQPAQPFVDLTHALAARFPHCPPYGGGYDEIVPHLTVSQIGGTQAFDALEATIEAAVPIRCRAAEAWVMEEGSDGMWSTRATFSFRGAA